MKQVLVINTSGLGVGGITTHIINYISNTKEDYKYTIISTIYHDEMIIKTFQNLGCVVVRLSDRKTKVFAYWVSIIKLMKHGKFDVVHVHGNSATMAIELFSAKLYGIRIRIAHSHNSFCTHKILHKILNPIFKLSYTKGVACSELAGNWIFGEGNFVVLKNGIDASKFQFNPLSRQKYRRFFGVDDNTRLFGNIGNIIEQKNQIFLLSIIKDLKQIYPLKLVIIGEGDQEQDLKQEIQKSGIDDVVIISPYRNDINNCLQAFDCFLLPSKWEGLPMILIEAQASGLPCCTSTAVTEEAVILPEHFVRLDLDKNLWVNYLKSSKNNLNREEAYSTILNSGFDMVDCVNTLRGLYG